MTTSPCSKLLDSGDRACAQRDVKTLAKVAAKLSARVGDPLRDRLHALSRLCEFDRELATERWRTLREQIEHRFSVAGT